MSSPKRYSNGVTNVATGSTLASFLEMDPTKVVVFWDDFMPYLDTDWVVTKVGTSTVVPSDIYVGGAAFITTDTSEDDGVMLQRSNDGGTDDLEAWRIQAGKKAWFKTKFQGSDVDQTDFIVGIYVTDTTPIAGAPTDGIWFVSDDGDANIDIHCVKNSVDTTAAAIGALVDATDITMGFYWDGVDTIHYFIDDVEKGTLSSGTIPNDEYMAVSFGCQAGEAAASTMTVDYIFAAMER